MQFLHRLLNVTSEVAAVARQLSRPISWLLASRAVAQRRLSQSERRAPAVTSWRRHFKATHPPPHCSVITDRFSLSVWSGVVTRFSLSFSVCVLRYLQ